MKTETWMNKYDGFLFRSIQRLITVESPGTEYQSMSENGSKMLKYYKGAEMDSIQRILGQLHVGIGLHMRPQKANLQRNQLEISIAPIRPT